MTKCKHKGECICGKHPKEEIEYITVGGIDYIQTTVDYGVWGDVTFEVSDKPIKEGPNFVTIDFSR